MTKTIKQAPKQFASLFGAGISAACCLGVLALLAAMVAIGPRFLINHAYRFLVSLGFVAVSLWFLFRSAQTHGKMIPFWVGLAAGVAGLTGLWLLVTGLYPMPILVYAGFGVLVASCVWDGLTGRRIAARATRSSNEAQPHDREVDPTQHFMTDTALSIAMAADIYGVYRSIHAFSSNTQAGAVDETESCFDNAKAGENDCATAQHACNDPSTVDFDPADFKVAPKGTGEKRGGS